MHKICLLRWYFPTSLMNSAKFGGLYEILAKCECEWQQIIEIFQVLRCNWSFFTCSRPQFSSDVVEVALTFSHIFEFPLFHNLFTCSQEWNIQKFHAKLTILCNVPKSPSSKVSIMWDQKTRYYIFLSENHWFWKRSPREKVQFRPEQFSDCFSCSFHDDRIAWRSSYFCMKFLKTIKK